MNNDTHDKARLVALSLILAVVAWSVVALSVNRTVTKTLEGVEIQTGDFGASYQSRGLDIIDNGQKYTCSVSVSGDASVIGALTADSVVVTPDFSPVSQAGTYSLTLEAEKSNPFADFTVDAVNPHTLTLTFGEVESRQFQVVPSVSGISVADGYSMYSATCAPRSVTVIGEPAQLDRISRVVASAEVSRTVYTSFTVTGSIKLLDDAGNELPVDVFRISDATAEVSVPVYMEGNLPLGISFVNVPDGFDISLIKYTVSPSSLRVAASEEAIKAAGLKTVGYIDLAELAPNVIYNFPLRLQSGFVNLDNVESVNVQIDFTGFSSKKVKVADIRAANVPAGYAVKVLTESINSVTLIGLADQLEGLLPSGVLALVDASEISLSPGTYTVPVEFNIPSCDGVWAAGSYTVVIEVEYS